MEPSSWELLAHQVREAQREKAMGGAALRAVVLTVVRELRSGAEPWDGVYAALQSAVVQSPTPEGKPAMGLEMHENLDAALVAHMHSWADVERLAEIERDSDRS